MIRTATLSILVIVAALALAPELRAQEKKGKQKKAVVEAEVHVGFSTAERQIIIDFFSKHPHEVTSLPPGIAKNLARGKPLPPGIAKKHIPADLKARLPARVGVEISIFGDRIVLLEASGLVVDILEGVFG